jgi:hypothetical protein
VTPLTDGGFFVTWQSHNQDNPGGADFGVFGQRFASPVGSTPVPVGEEIQINQTVAGNQGPTTAGDYAVTQLASGELLEVWTSDTPDRLSDVFRSTFTPSHGSFQSSPLTPSADEGSGFTFTITRLGGTGNATIQYTTADDSATAPGDYTATSGSVELAPGASATITVAGVEDTIDEASETFTVTLSNPTNGAAITDGMGVATATILDNDPTPTVSISDAQVTEGGELSFDVTLSAASGQTVTVDYATANGTAAAPDDYTAVTSTTLKFLPGQTSQTVTVTTIDDALDELAETLRVDLSGATNATIVDAIGQGTINDNDATPLPVVTVLAQDASGSEAGPDTVTFRFTRTGSTAMPLTVSFTVGGTVSDADFSPLVPTSINIPVGSASFDLVLTPDNDPTFEGSEDVTITLTETADYGLGPSGSEVASATIADNDLPPAFSISDATIVEGGNLSFTVTLDDPSGQTATVKYATSDGSAAAPGDYTAVNLTTLTFLPGQISKTVTVTTIDDAFDEPAETLKVTLSDATDATIFDAIGLGTIDDNDAAPLPVVTVAAFDGAGSETGPDGVTFRFTRTGDTSAPLTVSFTTGGTASGADVNPAVPTSTTIPIGSAFADLVLTPVDDTLIEGAESINVTLTDTAAYDLGAPATQAASATIADNDAASSSALTVKFVSASASYKNAFGWYNTQTLDGGLLFDAQGGKGLRSGASTTIDVDTADIPYIAYFLIPNAKGLRDNTADELSGAIKVVQMADGRWAIATVDANGNVETSSGGVPNVLVGTGAPALFSETSKNAGGVDYASSRSGKSQTAATLLADTADGPVGTLAWEDFAAQRRPNGTFGKPGDADYNDAVLSVSVTHGTTQDGAAPPALRRTC